MIDFKELKAAIQENDLLVLSQAIQELAHHIEAADDFDELDDLIKEYSGVLSYLYLQKLQQKGEDFYSQHYIPENMDKDLAVKDLEEIQVMNEKWLENQFEVINHIPERMSYELTTLLESMLLAAKHASLVMQQYRVLEVMEQLDYSFVVQDYIQPILVMYEAPFSSTTKAREKARQLWDETEQYLTLTKVWDTISEETVMGMTAIMKEYEALSNLESILYAKISIQHMVERLSDFIWEQDNESMEEVGHAFAAFYYLLESHSLLSYLSPDFYQDEIYVYIDNPLIKDYLECIRQKKWDEAISIAPNGYIPYYYKLYNLFMGYSDGRELNKIVEKHLDTIMGYLERVGEKFFYLYKDNCSYLPFLEEVAYDQVDLYDLILDKKSYVETLKEKNKQLEEVNEQLEEKSRLLEQKNRELELSMMKRRRMVDDFSHAWTNIIKPDIVYHVAESLKEDESYRHHYVALIRAYNDEVLAANECQMLKLTHADTERDPNRIRNFIRKGIAVDKSKGKGISYIINYALSRTLFRLLYENSNRVHHIKARFLENGIDLDQKALAFDHFVKVIDDNHSNAVIDWFNNDPDFFTIDVEIDQQWKEVSLDKNSVITTFLITRFMELFINAFTYGSKKQEHSFRISLYSTMLNYYSFLGIRFENTLDTVPFEGGTGEGLTGSKEMIHMLNSKHVKSSGDQLFKSDFGENQTYFVDMKLEKYLLVGDE